ncbi:hypothetical protein COY33_01905 [candidate division WWE3 bacterium CG_4_10_14_0_2_um_filter_42_7]|uniref:BrnT family toxin n=2 Tax=Katanobacteria TaxID=422282 RepID=A0A2H0X8G6_UNCKA|nr:MAG: hypothetical protein COT51_03890 [candidate division WWE3 bacterium CG08_land_8_20_14_0_20_41_15]PIZ43214.1 MAG: hypothetical protein COY33_01905 [candidate division WWE3 bacterium CG_4_10_14_0_2_um_filter_42_7]
MIINESVHFIWDKGNLDKNWKKHKVSCTECEELFFGEKIMQRNELHSGKEARYIAIGKTKIGRRLFVAFTIRKESIRIISARDLSKKERGLYEERT